MGHFAISWVTSLFASSCYLHITSQSHFTTFSWVSSPFLSLHVSFCHLCGTSPPRQIHFTSSDMSTPLSNYNICHMSPSVLMCPLLYSYIRFIIRTWHAWSGLSFFEVCNVDLDLYDPESAPLAAQVQGQLPGWGRLQTACLTLNSDNTQDQTCIWLTPFTIADVLRVFN